MFKSRHRLLVWLAIITLLTPVLSTAGSRVVQANAQTTTPAADFTADSTNFSPDIPDPSEPVTITFASWVSDSATIKELVAQFEKIHPNIKIKFQDVPAEEFNDKLTTQIAGGNPPDVAYMDMSAVTDFASRNALVNLDSYIAKSSSAKPDDFPAAFLNAVTYNNHLYGLPFDGESTALFYRTDLFKAAGIAKPPTTWAEFQAAAKALTNPDKKQYGFIMFAPEAAYYWYPWLWQAGGQLMSEDGKQVLFNSAAGKRAAKFYIGLKDYSPPDYFNSNSYDGRVAFATGKVGMYEAGAWFAATMMNEHPEINGKWSVAPLPKDQRCATTVAGDSLVILDHSKHKDAAWKWIEFLNAPQNMTYWNIGSKAHPATLLPPRKSLLANPHIFDNEPILKGFAQQMSCGVTNSINNPDWGKIEQELNDQLGQAIYGDENAATALDNAAEAAKEIMKDQQ